MARLYVVLFLVQIVLAVVALISCLSVEEDEIRGLPRLLWVVIILFFPLIGSIVWFLAGRPVTENRPARTWGIGGFPKQERSRPLGPDDDPQFLRSLDERKFNQDRELLSRWEADLRRREEELRRRIDDPPREESN
jgi:hypothetical protein